MAKLTTEEIDELQFGKVLHQRPAVEGQRVKVLCSACDATGQLGHEEGPRGATWTSYEKCPYCAGRGHNMRPC